MSSSDKIIKKIDYLINEGNKITKIKPNRSLFGDGEIAPIPFFAWAAEATQLFLDNFDVKNNAYIQLFMDKMAEAEKHYPSQYAVFFGITQLEKLKKYVMENPDLFNRGVTDAKSKLIKIYKNFHQISNLLANRGHNRPPFLIEKEYDVQDLLHALLLITFEDVRPEDWTPQYCGSSKRVDFLLKKEQIIIETKFAFPNHQMKEIGDELLIDIAHYKQKEYCKMLSCLIYDPHGYIIHRSGFISDIEKTSTPEFVVCIDIIP